MSVNTVPHTLRLFTFNGVATSTEQVVGFAGFPLTELVINIGGGGLGRCLPVLWEIKNDSTTDSIYVKWGSSPMTPASGAVLSDWIVLAPGQAYNRGKRHADQEVSTSLMESDLAYMRVQSAGGDAAFSAAVDAWMLAVNF